MRTDLRPHDQLRETAITPDYLMHAEGSVLITAGNTKVICTASVEDRVPGFLRNSGKGWVTAEYGMLPRATSTRMQREASSGKVGEVGLPGSEAGLVGIDRGEVGGDVDPLVGLRID